MGLLYLVSDVIFVLLWYLTRYRRKVVMDNLTIAFPEKSAAERHAIARAFYRNFVDNFIETLKLTSAGERFIRKRFTMDNPRLYEQFFEQGRKCQVHMGHTFNWEMANVGMPFYTNYRFLVVYMPLSNRLFDRLFLRIRSKTGTALLPATQMNRSILPFRNSLYMLTLVADQAPGNPESSYWLPYFGHPTPFLKAPERGARIGNIPVLFGNIYKTRRGHYHAVMEMGAEEPAALPEGELTRRYINFMERVVRQRPELYLWSHRRWKHAWKDEYKKLWIGVENPPVPAGQ